MTSKKYKILKDFPGNGDKVGSYVTYHPRTFPEYFGDSGQRYCAKYVENYPEFFEEFVNYEILELKNICNNIYWYKTIQGTWSCFPHVITPEYKNWERRRDKVWNDSVSKTGLGKNLDFYLSREYFIISRIKRLSDGQVFSIGDTVKDRSGCICTINEIWLNPNCNTQILFNHLNENIYIDDVVKPLFTSEDGVNIYPGDSYWLVRKDFSLIEVTADICYENPEPLKTFSTKTSAKNYIKENKPMYSYKDVKSIVEELVNKLITSP
jgi:hypothetical protein